MNPQQISAYVPQSAYLDGKQEDVYPRFYEDFAILDPCQNYEAIAARGVHLKTNQSPVFSFGEQDFLESHQADSKVIAVDTKDGIMLVFQHLFPHCGLLPVLLPHFDKRAVAYALHTMEHLGILLSPTVLNQVRLHSDTETAYGQLSQSLKLCHDIFYPSQDLDFRLHCAHIAQLAGCKVNVTELPVGQYPILTSDQLRWTAFLLCVFLTVRGDSALGTDLHLAHADRREFCMKLSHSSEYHRKAPITDILYRFLTIPSFSDFRLSRFKNRFSIEGELRRKHSDNLVHNPTNQRTLSILRIELFFDAENTSNI